MGSDRSLHLQVVAQCTHDLLDLLRKLTGGCEDQGLALLYIDVEALQHACTEGSSLARTRLSLLDDVEPLAERNDSFLLDGGRLLETCKGNAIDSQRTTCTIFMPSS
jgi:hypothetical protein